MGGIIFLLAFERFERNLSEGQYIPPQVPKKEQVHLTNYIPSVTIEGPDFTQAAEKTIDAVVHIRSQFLVKSTVYDDFFGALREYFGYTPRYHQDYPISGWGSGVIISSDGYIATNNHVVQDAELIEVTLNDKRSYIAKIIGNDPSTDLAVIKIKSKALPYLKYGNSDNVKVGEWVLAIGNPFNLTSTVTAGIVSARARNINILGGRSSIESFIQTDAAVNRGNSGGALVNIKSELIGINAAIASNTGSYTGYSFAIPVNIVKKVVEDLMSYGEVQRAYVGVIIREINSDFANEIGLTDLSGVYIEAVSDKSGAEAAGLQKGDVITNINDIEVNSLSQLLEVIGQYRPGDLVTISLKRDGKYKIFSVELRNEDGSTSIIKRNERFYSEILGATLLRISRENKRILGLSEGVKVTSINENGLLRSGGIRIGFIITEINDETVYSEENVNDAIAKNDTHIKIQGLYPNGMRVTYEFGL